MSRVILYYPHLDRAGGYPADFRAIVAGLKSLDAEIASATTVRSLRAHLARERPALVHLVGLYLWQLFPAALLSRRYRVPYVISTLAQETPLLVQRRRRLAKSVWIVAYARLVAAMSVGRHTFSSWEDRLGLPTKNVVRTGLPIHSEMGFQLDDGERSDPNSDTLVWFQYVGRKDITQKGLDLLLSALAQVADVSDEEIIARIEGMSDAETDATLRRMAENLGIGSRVQISGQGDGPKRSAARFFVYPSRFDGPPRPVRAALAAGMPVIVTEETGLGDLVLQYGAGLTCGASVPQLARALRIAMESSVESLAAASDGALSLADDLTASAISELLLDWYRLTIGGGETVSP